MSAKLTALTALVNRLEAAPLSAANVASAASIVAGSYEATADYDPNGVVYERDYAFYSAYASANGSAALASVAATLEADRDFYREALYAVLAALLPDSPSAASAALANVGESLTYALGEATLEGLYNASAPRSYPIAEAVAASL